MTTGSLEAVDQAGLGVAGGRDHATSLRITLHLLEQLRRSGTGGVRGPRKGVVVTDQ